MRKLAITIAVLAGFAAATAIAQAPSAADQIKARQANFKALGGSFKTIMDQTKAPSPDLAQIKAASAKLKPLATSLPTWFPKGTGPEAGVKTAAKAEIWTDAAGFAAAAKALQDAAAKLDAATDVAGAQAAAGEVGKACGGCHSKYREKQS